MPYDYEKASKGIDKAIKDYSSMMGERTKLQGQMLANQMQMKNNFFYKMKEGEAQTQQAKKMIDYRTEASKELQTHQAGLRAPAKSLETDPDFQTYAYLKQKKASGKKFDKMDESKFTYLDKKYGAAGTSGSSVDMEGLSNEDQILARNLARKFYGVRGAEKGLPAIVAEIKSGKTIDQIQDSERFAGQSEDFSGVYRDAAQTILINKPSNISQKAMDAIDDQLSRGNVNSAKYQLKRLARTSAGVEEQRNINGKERTHKLLTEIQNDLNALESTGVSTNIFTGTAENIASKVGTVKDPQTRQIATKIATAIQSYRRAMSGVAFSVPESAEYQAMFPSIGKTSNFNTANINALQDVMSGDLDNFYALSMGEDTYSSIFGDQGSSEGGASNKPQENIELPDTIKTTSQAIQHLMDNNNMTEEEATQWIRSQ